MLNTQDFFLQREGVITCYPLRSLRANLVPILVSFPLYVWPRPTQDPPQTLIMSLSVIEPISMEGLICDQYVEPIYMEDVTCTL